MIYSNGGTFPLFPNVPTVFSKFIKCIHTAQINVHVGKYLIFKHNIYCLYTDNILIYICMAQFVALLIKNMSRFHASGSISLLANNRINLVMYVYYSGQIYFINARIRVRWALPCVKMHSSSMIMWLYNHGIYNIPIITQSRQIQEEL